MRARDIRAIAFCILSTAALAAVGEFALHRWIVVVAMVAAYDAWLLTRRRMVRVIRRLRGEQVGGWSSYYQD